MTTPTYIRPTHAETGQPTLAVHFTAELCKLADAHQYDLEARTQDLATDVRDHLHQVGLAIRPTLLPGRARIVQEVNEGEEVASEPVFLSTVIAFLTDAEPGDARLDTLASGFYSGRVDNHVEYGGRRGNESAHGGDDRGGRRELRRWRGRGRALGNHAAII